MRRRLIIILLVGLATVAAQAADPADVASLKKILAVAWTSGGAKEKGFDAATKADNSLP